MAMKSRFMIFSSILLIILFSYGFLFQDERLWVKLEIEGRTPSSIGLVLANSLVLHLLTLYYFVEENA